jgi:hypothetical protein
MGYAFPGMEQRCARCGRQTVWLVETRTRKVAVVDVEEVFGGPLQRHGNEYLMGEPDHAALMGHRFHAMTCGQ